MKRMIDNKDYDSLKKNVNEVSDIVELHTTDYVIKSVVYEDEEVKGFQIKDVENDITYNIVLGGGGKQLYQHNINIYRYQKFDINATIITDSDTPFTLTSLFDYLYNKGFNTSQKTIMANGVAWYGSNLYNVYGLGQDITNYPTTNTGKHLIGRANADYLNVYENLELSSATFTDTIIPL